MDRARLANLLMTIYVVAIPVGVGLHDWRLGLIFLGLTSGSIGYLIGKD